MDAELGTQAPAPGRQAPGAAAAPAPERVLARLQQVLTLAIAWLLVFAVLVNIGNVVARYFFQHAMLGAEEIQVFAMVWITFLGAAVIASRDQHLRMDMLLQRLPAGLRKFVLRLEALVLAAISVFMLVQSARFTWQMVELGRASDALQVPMAIPHTGIVLGFALLSALAAFRLLRPRPLGASQHPEVP